MVGTDWVGNGLAARGAGGRTATKSLVEGMLISSVWSVVSRICLVSGIRVRFKKSISFDRLLAND
jgi:hypothetical protein